MKKRILKLNVAIYACAMILCGCTKKEADYTNNAKFVYTDIQESEKEITDKTDQSVDTPMIDSLGSEEAGDGTLEMNMGNGQVAVIQQQQIQQPDIPDMPLQDLQDFTSGDSETNSPDSTQQNPSDNPETPDAGAETKKPDEIPLTTEAAGDTEPTTPDAAPDASVIEKPEETPATTEAAGNESGNGNGTEQTPPPPEPQNPSEGENGDSGNQGNNENQPGDSTPSDAGSGESGTGETGNGDSGSGDQGGNNSGDNGTGNGDSGTGGSGEGGTGDGGNGDVGGDEPTDPGIGRNPDEVVRIWYEGTLGNYIWGEAVDTSNLKVFAELGDGSTKEVDAYSVNMNYPERYVAAAKQKNRIPKTYDPGVYQATISYDNVQIQCPYNLVALFVTVNEIYYGNCKDPSGHNATLNSSDTVNGYSLPVSTYVCDHDHDCFYWRIDSNGLWAATTAVYQPYYVPVYYDYTYTLEDFRSDDYFANLYFDTQNATGESITIYKNSVITNSYYAFANYTSNMRIYIDDVDMLKSIAQNLTH